MAKIHYCRSYQQSMYNKSWWYRGDCGCTGQITYVALLHVLETTACLLSTQLDRLHEPNSLGERHSLRIMSRSSINRCPIARSSQQDQELVRDMYHVITYSLAHREAR